MLTSRPIVAEQVEGAEANVLLRLPQQGYPFPEIGLRDIELDPATETGIYTLPLDPGPRAVFGGFTTEGALAFDAPRWAQAGAGTHRCRNARACRPAQA